MADEETPAQSPSRTNLHGTGKAYGVGMEFAAAVAGFCIVGWFMDRWLDSQPYGLLIGAILGIVGGMYNLIRYAIRSNRASEAQKTEGDRRDPDAP